MELPEIKLGDTFGILMNSKMGLIQCVKEERDITISETIRVLPGMYYLNKTKNMSEVINQKELFFSTLPLKYLLSKKSIIYIGNFKIPKKVKVPKYYRLQNNFDQNKWDIINAKTCKRKTVEKLNAKQLSLSPWGMVAMPDIIEKIETNWTPEQWH